MLPVGASYESERGTRIEVVSREGDQMAIERRYAPDTGHADPHRHMDLTQTWEALEGEGRIEVDGEERAFAAGDRIAIEPGTGHRDPWNPGAGKLKVRGSFDPNNDFIEGYAAAWAHLMTEGRVNDQDEMPLVQIIMVAKATDGESYAAGVPIWLQKLSAPLVVAFGRLRGYRASYE